MQVGLQLVGLALVAFSTTLPEASGVACLVLVAWQLLPARRCTILAACTHQQVRAMHMPLRSNAGIRELLTSLALG